MANLRGKYVLLDFWGSWCGPCRASHPHLKALQAHYGPQGLEVINIAQENGADARKIWLKAVEEDQMTWTQILNNEDRVKTVGESAPIDEKLKEVFGN